MGMSPLAGFTVAFGGLSLEAVLEDGELLPESTYAPQVGGLLCRQQLLHLAHGAERLLLAQALLGGHKDIPITRQTPPPPCRSLGGPCQAGSISGVGLDALPWAEPLPPHPSVGAAPVSVSAPASAPLLGPAPALGC